MKVFIITVIAAIIYIIIVVKIDGGYTINFSLKKNIKCGWLFRKHKYKIMQSEEGCYKVYQQTKLGFWFLLEHYYGEEAATEYIYRRYRETTKKHTKYVKYITIEPETDPTKLIG